MAFALPFHNDVIDSALPGYRARSLETPRRTLKSPSSGVVLWKPGIVLADRIAPVTRRPVVAVAEPSARPSAARSQIGATRSLLGSLATARQALDRAVQVAEEARRQADGDTARVAAAAETYRAQAKLDDVLITAFRQLTALMEERGLR
ncbi:MAG TPA: hypothetical protein VGL09_09910 [Methylomirabilota bacterium]